MDIAPVETIAHDRITYVTGSSTDAAIVSYVHDLVRETEGDRVLVILDSNHSYEHVLAELEAYTPLVPVNSFVHVQDGLIDELPMYGQRRGPRAAAQAFLRSHPEFVRDIDVELRYLLTAHPWGWLRRVEDRNPHGPGIAH